MLHFGKAQNAWEALGYSVINPALTNSTLPKDTSYEEYMNMSKTMLRIADAIYMLDNWKDSPGAKQELEWAIKWGLSVLYE